MTEQKAIELLKNGFNNRYLSEMKEAEALAIKALEKQKGKEPVNIIRRDNGLYGECPECKHKLLKLKYCGMCGQRMDWSKV